MPTYDNPPPKASRLNQSAEMELMIITNAPPTSTVAAFGLVAT